MASIRDRFGGKPGGCAKPLKHRQLTLDPLEERVLLSVYAADWDDVLVNQTTGTMQQGTLPAQSVATDHDGDFVVVWTRYDPVYQTDANGDPVLDPITGDPLPFEDPITGEPWQDANVYARYFTDEVQRLTLPDELGVSNDGNTTGGSFSLIWGGNEVQKISISGTYPPTTSYSGGYISGAVTFGFDVNGNGIVGPGETTPAIFFSEGTEEFTEIAANFETALSGLGGALSDVEVFGVNPHEYYVNFGDLSLGQNQPEITVESTIFTSGLYPAVLTSTVREPVEIGPIYLSATDPYQTVDRIQQHFLLTSDDFVMGPIEFPPDRGLQEREGPYDHPDVLRTAVPGVTVTPVWELDPSDGLVKPSLTKFDITFDGAVGVTEGAAGKRDHPLLVVSQAADETGALGVDLDGSGVIDPDEEYTALSEVVTLKEPSPEFRVNPPEPDDPNTPLPERFNQTRPDVAMDADGEFIITWEGDVPQGLEFGTISDVFARRFRPMGYLDSMTDPFHVDMDQDGIEETWIPGVQAILSDTNNDNLVDENDWLDINGDGVIDNTTSLKSAEKAPAFRVNTTTTGAQGQPAIGMDDEGYFVIAWGSGTEGLPPFSNIHTGQELGFFNGIRARRFDRDGTASGDYPAAPDPDFLVNSEITSMHAEPYVAMSDKGSTVITWTTTDDERYVNDWGYMASVEAKVYEPDGTAVRGQWSVAGGGGSATAFDDGENFVITTEGSYDNNDSIPGGANGGVRAIMYDLDILRTSGLAASVIRDTFRINSAAFDPADTPMWSGSQWSPEPALDADGELVVVYEGVGPETSENVNYLGSENQDEFLEALIDLFHSPENADLLPFYDPAVDSFPLYNPSFYDSNGNYIYYLYYMRHQGSTNEIDKDIENIIIRALKRTDPPATDQQIGRIRALIEEVVGLMQGESWGVMFSRFDADPVLGPQNILHSDCVANNERDGHNQTYILTISTDSTGGSFVLNVTTYLGPTQQVTINPVYRNQTLQVYETARIIEEELEDTLTTTGLHWEPHPQRQDWPFEGPVEVRVVSGGFGFVDDEITIRTGTPWDYDGAYYFSPDAVTDLANEAVYEIVFQGEAHDAYASISLQSANLQPQGTESPKIFPWVYGDTGTMQTNSSIGMEQDGDYVIAWTQYEEFTQSWLGAGVSNQNIYYRRFTETTDTAGPKMVDLINHYNEGVANNGRIAGPVRYVVLSFDEELKMGPPTDPNSAINPAHYQLFRGTTQIPEAVLKVEFGMNKAADLAGRPDGLGGFYPSTWTRSNRWEAVLSLDANGALMVGGDEGLKTGEYTIKLLPTVQDKAGNPLGSSGFTPSGQESFRTFVVAMQDPDLPISFPPAGGVAYTYGTTHPETPGAVAVDADGDHVVVWTGNVAGRDRVLMRVFDQYGSPAMLPELNASGNPTGVYLPSPVMWVSPGTDFLYDIQRHGNVAIDEDGDFVVTWTNYDDGDLDNPDVYARRFGLKGLTLDPISLTYVPVFQYQPFVVNTYTDGAQKWSDVAMDLEGDFVVTWSSYGQEMAEGALGTGYGVYARRYDSFGQPLAPEFRVNVTTGGNQQGSSVAMSGAGDFVVVWTSDQNGIGDDVIAREFFADGSPKVSPLVGEIVVNDIQAGDQRFPDISMRLDGENYIVTWTDSAADLYGTSIWAELAQPTPRRYTDSQSYGITATHRATIRVPDSITISDLNIQLGLLDHLRLQDLRFTLESPAGTQVMLFEDLPRPYINGTIPGYGPGYEMYETLFDDQASTGIRITDSDAGAVPPYNGTFVPQQLLNAFNGENAQGTWTLIIEDRQPLNNLTGTLTASPVPEIGSWSLIVSSPDISADSFLVNTTRRQNQMFSSAAMDNEGGFVITWSGFGDQLYEEDKLGHGVFYQKFDELATRIGLERRANSPVNVAGNQWISSVGTDARGNFVIAWTGDNLAIPPDPATGVPYTDVYTYVSVGDRLALDDDGPLVTDVLWMGNRVMQDDVLDSSLGAVTDLTVVFSEDMSLVITDGLPDKTNVENLNNWKLLRNGSEVIGGVIGVDFDYNAVTRRYEAVVSLDGNGINVGRPGLYTGDYMLTIKDDMTDVSIFFDPDAEDPVLVANRLDGDADGQPASNPITIGYGGYQHHFTVGSGGIPGLEMRINVDDPGTPAINELLYEQRFAAAFGTGLAREESTRSVAVDHDGDFVVVWTSYGETPGQPTKGDIYFRLYDRNNNPITDTATGQPMIQKRVNTETYGHQRNAAVAMDADGEFVIVWESEDQDPDGSWGIYGRRYNSAGKPILSDTNGDGEVILDRDGDGRVDPGDDAVDVNGDGFINLGDPAETAPVFRVNTEFTGHQLNPAVAMDDYGNLAIVWATAGQDFSFFNDVYGQRFNMFGERRGVEFLVNDVNQPGVGNFEVNPAVAMVGPSGEFAVAWDVVTAQQNGVMTDSEIRAKPFDVLGQPLGFEFRADTGVGSGGGDIFRVARNPQLAANDEGGYLVVWEAYMGNPIDAYDVYYNTFGVGRPAGSGQINMPGTGGAGDFAFDQVNPSVAVDADGDFAVVWNGQGAQPDPLNPLDPNLFVDADDEGIFIRRYDAADEPVEVQSRVNRTQGGIQQFPTIAMEPDGDAIVVWNGRGVGDQHGIFARRYDEPTDTAGPLMTELRDPVTGELLSDDPERSLKVILGVPSTLDVILDENMWQSGPDDVENVENWLLTRNGVEVKDAIASVDFGLDLDSNKWRATIHFVDTLAPGHYEITALHPIPDDPSTSQDEGQSGLRDAVGNPIGRNGRVPGGTDLTLLFYVGRSGVDPPVTGSSAGDPSNARTHAEGGGAVAVDSDGDYVVAWTQPVDVPGVGTIDKVFVRMFDPDNNAVSDAVPVTTHTAFVADAQRYGAVAIDADGDLVVTWTNYHGDDADVYARRFSFDDTYVDKLRPMGAAFRVHTYTGSNQKWSDVAMDPHGDFVVTWSSFGQEDGGNLGSEYGVYARRFNRFGQPLGTEFGINVTTGGNQRFSAIDMAENGNFVITWTSDQNGIGDDIIARLFEADGKPKIGPLGGELVINAGPPPGVTDGHQSHSDVQITPSGNDFVVIWTSAGEDGSGDGIFGRTVNVPLLEQQEDPVMTYTWTGPRDFWFGNTVRAQINVPFDIPLNNFTIADVNVTVDIDHPYTYDVKLTLESPAGTSVVLVENEPDPTTPSSDFAGTVFDDEMPIPVTAAPPLAVGPYNDPNGYQPEDLINYGIGFGLDAFDGETSSGTWTLICQDNINRGFPFFQREIDLRGTLNSWELVLERKPAMGNVFQINETTLGNQNYGSMAMNRRGSFTVVWSGRGDQPLEEDKSGEGVFFRSFDISGNAISSETRANLIEQDDQRFASIDADGVGNFTIVWMGDDPLNAGATDVYGATSQDFVSFRDLDGPVVSDVFKPDGSPLLDGDAVADSPALIELTVAFSEDLSVREGDIGPDSVENPDNWVLKRNGSAVPGAIDKVSFGWNAANRKYEAVLTLDASSIGGGTQGLPQGTYELTVLDTITDAYDYDPMDPDEPYFQGNSLDGDFDGTPGTSAAGSGAAGYVHRFSVVQGAAYGPEYLINTDDPNTTDNELYLDQRFAEARGTGYAREESTRSVAVDHDGDYVVVWTSYGQDVPSDINGAGVYFRMFDRLDNEIRGQTLVNTTTAGHQRNAAVAMDADGDFVVVWEGQNDNVDGSWGIYGQRFNSVGQPVGNEFLVNTTVQNDQLNPNVATDDFGNFLVVWASKGQSYGYFNDVVGKLFNYRGEEVTLEFVVNTTGVPGTLTGPGSIDLNPAVAMDDLGNFVVVWDQVVAQLNGAITDSEIRGRVFDFNAVAAGGEFPVGGGVGDPGDPDIGRVSRNPQVAMQDSEDVDLDGVYDRGGFVVVWESFIDQPDAGYDVFFEEYGPLALTDPDPTSAILATAQVNLQPAAQTDPPIADLVFDEDQVNPTVGIDADGDFVIGWNGKGARPYVLGSDPPTVADLLLVTEKDDEGVFIRSYGAADPGAGPQPVTVQSRVNRTQPGIQQFPSIGVQPDGNMIVVWNGAGIGDHNGIFGRRYEEPTDTAGPKVSDLTTLYGERIDLGNTLQPTQSLTHLVVTFDEEMMAGAPASVPESVLNTQNYRLIKDGVQLPGGIVSVQFGLNKAWEMFPAKAARLNKWEAVLEVDGDYTQAGANPLGTGEYQLTISEVLRDVVGNRLNSSGTNPVGREVVAQFHIMALSVDPVVNTLLGGNQELVGAMPGPGGGAGPNPTPRAVDMDADGEYVVVWTDSTTGNVWGRMYNGVRWANTGVARGLTPAVPGAAQFLVSANPTARYASVARDADGDFVVVWEQDDDFTAGVDWNIWARRYDAQGTPFAPRFRVNSVTQGNQRYAAVAMDDDGDFVVTWQSNDVQPDFQGHVRDGAAGYGIYAQRYDAAGEPLGGNNEVQLLTFAQAPVGTFRLNWDGDNIPGTPNVTAPITINGNASAIAATIEANLNALAAGVNFVEVQALSQTEVMIHFTEQSANANHAQITVAATNFANPLSTVTATTLWEGYAGEFLVNDTTAGDQTLPSIAMSADGDFVIAWTHFFAAGDNDIHAKKFVSNDSYRSRPNQPFVKDSGFATLAAEIISTDPIANHAVDPGTGYDGVASVTASLLGVPLGFGSGTLLATGRHILTAAHVVSIPTALGTGFIPGDGGTVTIDTPRGPWTIAISQVSVHPGFDWGTLVNDIAIVTLEQEAPAEAERYQIYRANDELFQRAEFVGYGNIGEGPLGQIVGSFGAKYRGANVFETLGDALNGMPGSLFGAPVGAGPVCVPGAVLVYDFDSGSPANDSLGVLLGINDLGLGEEEAATAQGDSGGPAFINGLIAGVNSWGMEPLVTDVDGIPGSRSFSKIGAMTRVSFYADWIDDIVESTSAEFLVNTAPGTLLGNETFSSVAMDADGDFVVSWSSDPPGGGADWNVWVKRFNADTTPFVDAGNPAATEFQVILPVPTIDWRSQVAMDADGDFIVTWGQPPGGAPPQGGAAATFAQRFYSNDWLAGNAVLGTGANGGPILLGFDFGMTALPTTYVSVAMDDAGDWVVAREGGDLGGDRGVFQWFGGGGGVWDDPAGPRVADVVNVIPTAGAPVLEQVRENANLEFAPTQFLISFGENLYAPNPFVVDSILLPANWVLSRDGVVLPNGVATIAFGLNQSLTSGIFAAATNKHEAVITLDGDPTQPGDQPLRPGEYVLTIQNFVEDQFNNRLDGDSNGTPNGVFRRSFTVANRVAGPIEDDDAIGDADPADTDELVHFRDAGNQGNAAVASDRDGYYVVAWVETVNVTDPYTGAIIAVDSDIKARRFNPYGEPVAGEFIVNSYRTGNQVEPAVAMDDFGNFVVAWSGQGEVNASGTLDQVGVFARVFDSFGNPMGEQFAVNQSGTARTFGQREPSVAMDADGDFVVSWTSYGQDGEQDGVYARRYNFLGQAQGDEFVVNTVWRNYQAYSDVAMDDAGNFVVVWSANQHPGDNSEWCICLQRYRADGVRLGGEVVVNTYTLDDQMYPAVAMDANGDFVVTWASEMTDGSDWGVYARRYSAGGGPQTGAEVRVNQTTAHWQYQPDVSMDASGRYVITWTSAGQDNPVAQDKGVYARVFNATGTDFVVGGFAGGEFLVNANVAGDQFQPAVAMDTDGDFTIAWTGPDADANGVYYRRVRINALVQGPVVPKAWKDFYLAGQNALEEPTALVLQGTSGNDVFELVAGPTASTSTVLVNGVAQAVGPQVTSIQFDGLGGKDRVILNGSVSDETVELWPDHGTFTADQYEVSVVNVEVVDAYGGGGNDVAMLRDDPNAADYARLEPGYGRRYGTGFDNEVSGFRYVHAYGSDDADDVALLYDDPHTADTLEVTPDAAIFSGSGFFSRAVGFRYVHGYATEDSGDVAILRDNPDGKDTFEAWPDQSKLSGSEFFARVRSFAEVRAYATEGSGDVALLYDNAEGKDTFKATPDQADLYGDGFRNRAHSFDSVRAYATEGSGDLALLYGDPNRADTLIASPDQAASYGVGFHNQANSFDFVHGYAAKGNGDVAMLYGAPGQADTLEARPDQTVFSGAGFYTRAKSFDYVHGYATEGDGDAALLYDDAETADTFEAWPEVARFVGKGFYNRVKSFDYVHAYATEGSGDVALLRDDPNTADTFEAWPDVARLVGAGFSNRALSFDYVHAYATEGGKDVALLHDNPDTADAFDAWPDMARLYGSGFYNRVKSFDYVHAYATPGGKDVAKLYDDPQTADTFEAWPEMARLRGSEFYNRALSFRYVLAYATQGGNDVAKLYDSEGKDTLVASPQLAKLYNGSFFNQAKHFRNTYSYSTKGGYDTAYLYDSALEQYPDHLETGTDWVRLSNELLGYAHWLKEFEEVTVTLSNDGDTRDVDPDALDFILYDGS